MALPLLLLSFGSIYVGFLFKDLMIGQGNNFLTIHNGLNTSIVLLNDGEYISTMIKLIPLFMCILGLSIYFLSFQIIYLYCCMYNVYIFKTFKFFINK